MIQDIGDGKTSYYLKPMDDIMAMLTSGYNNNISIQFHVFSDAKYELSIDDYSRYGKYDKLFI